MNPSTSVYKQKFLYGKHRQNLLESENPLNIAVGIDGNFIIGMGVLLVSILKNNPKRNINYHIFTDSTIDQELHNLELIVAQSPQLTIIIHYLDPKDFAHLPSEFIWTTAIYYRFLVPIELEKLDIDYAWYLDSDQLCLKEISEPFISPTTYIAALESNYSEDRQFSLKKLCNKKDIVDLASAGIYINIKAWQKDNLSQKAFYHLTHDDLSNYKYFDGDALIKVVDTNYSPLPEKQNYVYNLITHHHTIPQDTEFIHFAGTAKPWQAWALTNEKTKIWLSYKAMSPWKNRPMDMPKNYKQAKFLAKMYKRQKDRKNYLKWQIIYVLWKLQRKK